MANIGKPARFMRWSIQTSIAHVRFIEGWFKDHCVSSPTQGWYKYRLHQCWCDSGAVFGELIVHTSFFSFNIQNSGSYWNAADLSIVSDSWMPLFCNCVDILRVSGEYWHFQWGRVICHRPDRYETNLFSKRPLWTIELAIASHNSSLIDQIIKISKQRAFTDECDGNSIIDTNTILI